MPNLTKNYKYCTDAIKLKNDLESGFIELGKRLSEIKAKQLYTPSWESWGAYTAELKMSENQVNKLVQIYDQLIQGLHVDRDMITNAGGWTVIAELLPVIETKKDADEWLNKAATLTREDLRKEIQEKKSGIPMKDCKHKNTYTIVVCRDCGIKMEDHKDHE